jgi:hypothetical protein
MVSIRIQIQRFRQMRIRPSFDDITWKNTAEKFIIYLSLGLYKGRPSYRRTLQPSKENIQPFQVPDMKFLHFFLSFRPSLIRIRIPNADPDPAYQNQRGSGSKTLLNRLHALFRHTTGVKKQCCRSVPYPGSGAFLFGPGIRGDGKKIRMRDPGWTSQSFLRELRNRF